MKPRRRRPTLEERLDALSDLRSEADASLVVEKLREALRDKSHVVAGRAAKVAADLGIEELYRDMAEAFDRFLIDPVETDKGCIAKIAIAKALVDADHPAVGLYRRGIRHVQMEGSFGPPVDAAIELRANCAIGLANSGAPSTVLELVPLLADPGLPVRLAAVEGIAASGDPAAEAVLRLKIVTGDDEPEVVTEAAGALLRLAPERSLGFLRPLLDAPDAGIREAVILALGESRAEEAVPVLVELWERPYLDRDGRRAVLLALVTTRREPALGFLLKIVAEGDRLSASEAISALAIHRHDEKIHQRVAEAVEENDARDDLRRTLAREFRN